MARWLLPKVEECTTARSMEPYTLSKTWSEHNMAPTGM